MRIVTDRRAFLALLAALAGCSTTTVEPLKVAAPTDKFSSVVVGDISTKDELWRAYAIRMRRAMIDQLRKTNAFAEVIDSAGAPVPAGSMVATGQVFQIDKGNLAARWIIGFGAGLARAAAVVQLDAAADGQLVRFTVRKAYSGGAGIGGADLVDMDDLADKLGVAAADTIVTWVKTGKVE